MKKLVALFLIVFIVASAIFLIDQAHNKNMTKQVADIYQPPEKSREELYQDNYISLLMPYIQKEVASYYSKILKSTPHVAPYDVNVLDVKRPNGYRSFVFELKLKVIPYVGPHIGVGVDYITMKIASRKITIESFEHIKSYNLPPHYQHLLINNRKEQ